MEARLKRRRLVRKVFGESPESLRDPLLFPKDVIEQMRRLGEEISYKGATRRVLRNKGSSVIQRERV